MAKNIKKIKEVAHHRNGVCGAPFWVVLFTADSGDMGGKKDANFIATIFGNKRECNCAVVCLDLIGEHGVTFAQNSWRGDHFSDELWVAIENYQREKFGWTDEEIAENNV